MSKDMSTDAKKDATGAVRLRLADRTQMAWVAQCLDEQIPADHEARTVWALVCGLDLSGFHAAIAARDGQPGRNSTDPRILVALWLYAAIRGVGKARELDRLCEESDPYRWIRGGVSLNYHTLADFRVQHKEALEALFANVIATLVKKGLAKVDRLTQDGVKVRAGAGAASFRRGLTLAKLQAQAAERMKALGAMLDDPLSSAGDSAAQSARQKAAQERAARERQRRVSEALELIPHLQERQRKAAQNLSQKQQQEQQKEPRASTTDPEARRMKMADGGFRPAYNVQVGADPHSRAILAVQVTNEGVDYEQSEPLRDQVQNLCGQTVLEHLYDGGYVTVDGIEEATQQGVIVYAPPKPPRNPEKHGDEFTPRPNDSEAIVAWRLRMGSAEGKAIYKERAATNETINAQLRQSGLTQLTVRGLNKATCVVLWMALAYDLMLFATELLK
jgi:transposase